MRSVRTGWVGSAALSAASVLACGGDFTFTPLGAGGAASVTSGTGGAASAASGTGGTPTSGSATSNGAGGTPSVTTSASSGSASSTTATASSGASSSASGGPGCPGEDKNCVNEFASGLGTISDIQYSGGSVWAAADHAVYRIQVADAQASVVAGSKGVGGSNDDPTGTNARFGALARIALDTAITPAVMYVADAENCTIRRITMSGGFPVTTLAGAKGDCSRTDGPIATARFKGLAGLALDTVPKDTPHAYLFVTDEHTVRRVDLTSAAPNVATVAGQATGGFADNVVGTSAMFHAPSDLMAAADWLIVADPGNHRVRRISQPTGSPVETVFGSTPGNVDGPIANALLNGPRAVTPSNLGAGVFVADTENNTVRFATTNGVTTLAGGLSTHAVGVGVNAGIVKPMALSTGTINKKKTLFIVEDGSIIRRMPLE